MIKVEVAYAETSKQVLLSVRVLPNATVEDAIFASGILQQFSELDCSDVVVGIFGRKVDMTTRLKPNDRVEIYRPLLFDPKISRLRRNKKS